MKSTNGWALWVVATICVILHFLGFLVYNEETILLGCFLLFVVFAYNSISSAIVDELEDRGNRIGEVYEASRIVALQAAQELIEHHARVASTKEVTEIWLYQKESLSLIAQARSLSLRDNLNAQAKAKLNTLQNKEQKLIEELQKEIVARLSRAVSEKFGVAEGPSSGSGSPRRGAQEAIKEGIGALRLLSRTA
jgi:hypothetical protein